MQPAQALRQQASRDENGYREGNLRHDQGSTAEPACRRLVRPRPPLRSCAIASNGMGGRNAVKEACWSPW